MNFLDMIYYWARAVPHRAAVIQMDAVTTYQALADTIESIGEHIDRLNLDKGEPVAVCLANPSFMLATVFALLRHGYSAAPVNLRLFPHLAGAGIRNLIYDMEGQVASGGRNIRFDMSWLPPPRQPGPTRAYRKRPFENTSLIFFTSGTTGTPKKVVQPAAALDERLRFASRVPEAHQKVFVMLGLTAAVGLNRICEVFNLGKTVCFAADSVAALSLINLFGVEVVVASPTQALALAEAKNDNPGYRTDTLKQIFVSGGKIASEAIARVRSLLCRNIIHQYGSTEVGMVARTPFDVLADRPAVMAFPWVELEVVDGAGRPLPPGAEGLIRLRTPQLTETIKAAGSGEMPAVRDGWFYPGDIGALDDAGILRLAGRGSDIINRGGVKISGQRIEETLRTFSEIKDAAVCGVTGPSGLEEIWVGIVPNGCVDVDRIKSCLREHKEIGIAPDEVFLLDRLPRGDQGKVEKSRLKEQLIELRRGS